MSTTLANYLTQVQRLVHDVTGASFSTAELIDYINTAREDTSLDMHCVRSLRTKVCLIPGQEFYHLDGAVVGAVVSNGGVYEAPPSVTFSVGGTVTAQGTAVLNGTAVSDIAMTQWGQGYTSAPTIIFNPAGAVATPVWFNNVFNVVSITNIWNNQRYLLNWRGFTLFQAYFRAWNMMFNARPGVWTIHPQDLIVYVRPAPDQTYWSEWDVIALAAPLVNLNDVDTQVKLPWNKAVPMRAAALALMKTQNFEQSEYYDRKYSERVPRYVTGQGGIRIPNVYNRSFQRKVERG